MLFCASTFIAQKVWMTPNKGQWDDRIQYSVELDLGKLYIQDDGLYFYLTDFMLHDHEHEDEQDSHISHVKNVHTIHQKFIGHNEVPSHTKSNPSFDYKNYIIGTDSSKWKHHIYSYNEV